MDNNLNPIWLGKNKRAAWDDYYGWAGDFNIASVVVATNPEEAAAILAKSENKRYFERHSQKDFLRTWEWEQIGLTDKDKQVLLHTFGAY